MERTFSLLMWSNLDLLFHIISLLYNIQCLGLFSPQCIEIIHEDFVYKLSESLKIGFDVVINASGYTGRPNVDACEDNKDDTWYYNVTVPGIIADTCMEHMKWHKQRFWETKRKNAN